MAASAQAKTVNTVNTNKGVSASNTPQAKDDVFTGTEDVARSFFKFDVMENDAGGSGKHLHSIGASALGTSMRITDDGKIGYELTESAYKGLQSLGAGQTWTDSFTYAIQMGNGTLSWATAKIEIKGINDAPIFSFNGGENESNAIQVAENSTGSFLNVTARDPESDAITYSLGVAAAGSSNDNALFRIDATTGKLEFIAPPDYESAAAGNDNAYKVQVSATDIHGASTSRDVFVNVTDVQETVRLLVDFNDLSYGDIKSYSGFNWSTKLDYNYQGTPYTFSSQPYAWNFNPNFDLTSSHMVNTVLGQELILSRADNSDFSLISLKLGGGRFALLSRMPEDFCPKLNPWSSAGGSCHGRISIE
jgi:VCBS repeat-containing protein